MSTNFREFVFENRNSISVTLTLEAPAGTQIIHTTVAANASVTLKPNVNDVRTAKIIVIAEAHPEFPDVETLELVSSPRQVYLETLRAHSSIGSINGSVSGAF